MTDLVQDACGRLVRQSYRPFERASDLVRAFLCALIDSSDLRQISAYLSTGRETVRVSRDGRCSASDAVTVPLVWQRRQQGELSVLFGESDRNGAVRLIDGVATVLARLLQRYEARDFAREHLGSEVWLVGADAAVLELDERLERVAALPMPLLIEGEFGCEARAVAVAVHVGSRGTEPFVELSCGEVSDTGAFRAALETHCQRLGHGTLFLADVDELDPACQKVLLEQLLRREMVQRWPDAWPAAAEPASRVIASASRRLRDLVDHDTFSRALWSVLDFVRVRLRPLRERRGDVPHLIEHFSARLGHPTPPAFSPEAVAILSAHEWRGNLAELARVVARLVAVKGSGPIGPTDLREWASELSVDVPAMELRPATSVGADDSGADEADAGESAPEQNEAATATALSELARQLLAGQMERLALLHPGMRRALTYLVTHFQDEISLDQLAHESFVSPSYLSALFKRTFGLGFKRFQSIVRVERAKQLLVADPHQRITDVSLEIGFGDFSHFLKTFKRLVHRSPREYRKQHSRVGIVPLPCGKDRETDRVRSDPAQSAARIAALSLPHMSDAAASSATVRRTRG